ncbi:MAG TPA: glycosyltransferase family 4 protein [Acidimicrobiia bacterium]|nr:glycosyltransferase family 4 protein [Acidimicrobiia bacterium]
MSSLLVTNDFPPKLGGIQSYLHELWRRLPPDDTTVFTTRYDGDLDWDAEQAFRVVRSRQSVFLPTRALAADVEALARDVDADVVFFDPWLPLGALAPRLHAAPYAVVVHGAEVTVPGHLPASRALGGRVLRGASAIVAAGDYPAREATRAARSSLPGVVVPPGVDTARFVPLDPDARAKARAGFGLDPGAPLVVGISRLVPRKGFDVLIDAVAALPGVHLAIGGAGRDQKRLAARAAAVGLGERAHFLGRVPDAELPALYGCADVFSMPCRDRWGGLEAEGFGIVFLEAAAAGVPAVAGRSGGSHEAVVDGVTGVVVDGGAADDVRDALAQLLGDHAARRAMGDAARDRAVREFSYDLLVERLAPVARAEFDGLGTLT